MIWLPLLWFSFVSHTIKGPDGQPHCCVPELALVLADQPEAVSNAALKSKACLRCRAAPDQLSSNEHPVAPERTFAQMRLMYEAIQAARDGIAQLSDEPADESQAARRERKLGIRELKQLIDEAATDVCLSCTDGSITCSMVACNIDIYRLSPAVERVCTLASMFYLIPF